MLLSVGYSSCHWCHVMAHESFEDPDIAAVMNDRFVNVKVDREERPDVDAIYMHAVQAMTGRGGWPMTVFLDADGRPFFGGTYFPSADRQGMPGFLRVMDAVDDAWRNRRADLLEQAGSLADAIARTNNVTGNTIEAGTGAIAPDVLAIAVERIRCAVRPAVRRLRRRAEVPAGDDADVPALPSGARPGARDARDDHGVARRHGRRRDVRPGRRWVPPVLGRRVLARAPLREDALRPGAAPTGVPARMADHPRAAVSARRRGDHRLRAARPPPRRGRLLLRRGRRLRGRRGQVLLLVARRAAPGVRRRQRRGDPLLRRHRGRQLRGPAHRVPRQHPARRPPRRAAPACRGTGAAATRWNGVRAGCGPGLDDKVLLGWNALFLRCAHRSGLRARSCGLARSCALQRALPRHGAPARRRAAAPVVAGTGGHTFSGTARTTPRCSRRCSRSPRSTTSPGSTKRARLPTSSSGSSPTTRTAGSSPPAPMRRRSSCDRRTSRTTPRRRRTRSPRDALLRLAALTGDDTARGTSRALDRRRSHRCSPSIRPRSRTCCVPSSGS